LDNFAVDLYLFRKEIKKMAYEGDFTGAIRFLAEQIAKQTSVRDFIQKEKIIQGFFIAYLNLFDFYISTSEEEQNKGYADMIMKPFYLKYKDIQYAYLFEFKYINRTKENIEFEQKMNQKITESKAQLDQYSNDDFAKKMLHLDPYGNVKLKKGIIIFHGWELVHLEEYK
jgi:hypothetical protein